MKKTKIWVVVVALLMIVALLVSCAAPQTAASSAQPTTAAATQSAAAPASSAAASSTASVAAASASAVSTPKFNYQPVKNTTGKQIKIATLCVQNNPFWVTVVQGIKDATSYLAGSDYNCQVDLISFNDFTGQSFSDAINTCVVKGYNAICTVGVADSIVPAIDAAVKAGIPVYTFNSDTTKPSQKTAFIGQDLYNAGVLDGETLGKLMGGKGKAAIITGEYNVNAHELRRNGIIKGLGESSGITVVGSVEDHDSADEAYTETKDFISAHPDLTGIAVTAGGPHGAAKAIDELGLKDKIQLVCFDTTTEIISYIRKGDIKASIGQDPYGQGADPIILAYNQIITGKPQVTGNAFTKMDIYTPDNINQYFPQ